MFKKIAQYLGLIALLYALTALLIARGSFTGIQNSLQNYFYDYESASSKILVVAIDEKSLSQNALGPLQSWQREYYAEVIENLNSKGVETIGLDITLPGPSVHGLSDDQALQNTLREHRNVIMAGRYYFEDGERQIELPNETLQQADPTIGWINVSLDEDGFVRKVPLFADVNGDTKEAFALAVARDYLGKEPVDYRVQSQTYRFADNITIPAITKTDKNRQKDVHFMYVNYFAEPNGFTRASFSDIYNERFQDTYGNPINLNDKIVLIGPTAIDLQDDYLSPVSRGVRMPGVEIHANTVQTIVEQEFLHDQSAQSLWLTLLGILAVNVALFAFLRLRYAIPLTLLEIIGFLVAGIVAYEYNILLNVVYPITAILFSFVGTYLLRYILEQRERKFIENAFGHYVNKSVVEHIIKNPNTLELGGAKREISVMFSDIADFTTISESMQPSELVKFLNEYLKEMTDIILDEQGTLDKYEGDAIMAFWNAPLPLHDHPKNVCRAALRKQDALKSLRKKWKKEGKPEIHVRIGLNLGNAIVGNMGSQDRFDYTAIGDDVNLASRLEGINKEYGTEIILSEDLHEKIKNEFACRELDRIRVKGKNEPVRIYELMDYQKDLLPVKAQLIKDYEAALALYRERKFSEAKEKFAAIKDDPASEVMQNRCEQYLKNPPANDWDGVHNFTSK